MKYLVISQDNSKGQLKSIMFFTYEWNERQKKKEA